MRKTTRKSLVSQTRPSRTNKRKSLSPQKLISTTKKATGKTKGTTKIPEPVTITKEAIITRDATNNDQDVKEVIKMATVRAVIKNTETNNLEKVMIVATSEEVGDKVAVEVTEIEASVTSREMFLTLAKSTTRA